MEPKAFPNTHDLIWFDLKLNQEHGGPEVEKMDKTI